MDNGLLRKNERQRVEKIYKDNFKINLKVARSGSLFLKRLKGVKGWLEEKRPEFLNGFRFVGISLDAKGDSVETVESFLKAQGHKSKQWDYLMSPKSLHPLMRDGFLLGVREGNAGLAAAHTDRVVLVGKYGQIRGYYDLSANETIAQLNGHIDLLMKEPPQP